MPYPKSERSAAQIVAAATRVLAAKGYARTSLLDIAREAGMSKGALHYHFPSKESLVSKVLESALDTFAARTLDVWARTPGDPMQALRSSVRELWLLRRNRTDEVAVVADLLAQSLYDPNLRPQIAAYYRFASQQVNATLVPTLAALGLRTRVAPELVPRLLNALLDGLVMQHLVDDTAIDTEEVLKAFDAIAFALIEPIPPQG
jgi:AcrR family transcriptional regulator